MLTGIKEVILIREEVNHLSAVVTVLIADVREHDRRLIRLETIADMGDRVAQRRLPKR